jgi:hypothetical protein
MNEDRVKTQALEGQSAESPRPYSPPRLRYLGSVRELTLGSSGRVVPDSPFGNGRMKM